MSSTDGPTYACCGGSLHVGHEPNCKSSPESDAERLKWIKARLDFPGSTVGRLDATFLLHILSARDSTIAAQTNLIEQLQSEVVFGFYEEEKPDFVQGYNAAGGCELCEPVTAAEIQSYVDKVTAWAGQLALQKEEIERLNGMLGNVGRELDDKSEEIAAQANTIREQKAEIAKAKADVDLHISMHAITVGEYEKLRKEIAQKDAEIDNLARNLIKLQGEYNHLTAPPNPMAPSAPANVGDPPPMVPSADERADAYHNSELPVQFFIEHAYRDGYAARAANVGGQPEAWQLIESLRNPSVELLEYAGRTVYGLEDNDSDGSDDWDLLPEHSLTETDKDDYRGFAGAVLRAAANMLVKPSPPAPAEDAATAHVGGQPEAGGWPDPTTEMLNDERFNAIWNVIKTWDINVPSAYEGYCGATGNHARAIFDALFSPAPAEDAGAGGDEPQTRKEVMQHYGPEENLCLGPNDNARPPSYEAGADSASSADADALRMANDFVQLHRPYVANTPKFIGLLAATIAAALTAAQAQGYKKGRQDSYPEGIKHGEARAYERAARAIRQLETPDTLTNDCAFGWEHCRDKAVLIIRALATPSGEKTP